MDTHFLESFISVVELGSIAEAARRLDLTTGAVAQRLKALEAELGSPLVLRVGRTVKPTAAGLGVMAHAPALLRTLRDLQSAASATSLPAGPLRLGVIPTGMTGMLPPLLRAWVKRHPTIELYIEPSSTTQLYGRVLDAGLDVALLVHPLFDLPKTCIWQPLRRERLVLVTPLRMRVDDPLLTAATEPFILYDRKVVGGRLADAYLRSQGVRPAVRFELDGIESISHLVAEGLGVSVLPDWVAARSGGVRRWPLPPPCPERTVGLLWLRDSARAPLAAAFAALASTLQGGPVSP